VIRRWALMGKACSAPVGLRPVTDPISFVTLEALGVYTQRLGKQRAPEKVILFGFRQDLHLQRPECKASA
jgi:hypothetical protein